MSKQFSTPVASFNERVNQRYAEANPNINTEYREAVISRYREVLQQHRQLQLRLQKRIEMIGLQKATEEAKEFKRLKQLKHENVAYLRNGDVWTVNGNHYVESSDTVVTNGSIYKVDMDMLALMRKLKGLDDFSMLLSDTGEFDLTDPMKRFRFGFKASHL
ncbi:hypothetical protein K493DRAFT_301473 [Basidiobolus meristosporus CBS 931.73]|uniref:Uncharacterized protein n=1 Tax=Basidiobolus meristosporus CBS 931.73 TaxID=1314790 RepID=A0A1Y1YBV0_9FUNG|nr:hypothetical protein K493DRAFT_301473 [Basidiobolus meristosporus CBS 931.73]|eukprot:ORX95413.1 hypothetical protein K493DRAFT_301473 [Basidiobolus meristosporus CBS 931.73]